MTRISTWAFGALSSHGFGCSNLRGSGRLCQGSPKKPNRTPMGSSPMAKIMTHCDPRGGSWSSKNPGVSVEFPQKKKKRQGSGSPDSGFSRILGSLMWIFKEPVAYPTGKQETSFSEGSTNRPTQSPESAFSNRLDSNPRV